MYAKYHILCLAQMEFIFVIFIAFSFLVLFLSAYHFQVNISEIYFHGTDSLFKTQRNSQYLITSHTF